MLFDFTIKYQTSHSNRATDALNHCPFNPSCDFNSEPTDSDEVDVISYSATCDGVETIPYSLVCEALDQCLNGSKISIVEEEYKQEINEIISEVDAVSVFGKVTPVEMKEGQQKDPMLKLIYKQVTAGEKPKTPAITKVKSKAVRKYLLQFNRLI